MIYIKNIWRANNMTKVYSEKNEKHDNWSWQRSKSMKYKLHVSVSDLVRAKTSQKVIDELMELYDNLESPKADITEVTPFTNAYLKGIHISIACENKNDGRRYKEEFNSVYENLARRLKRKPIKIILLIDSKQLELIKKF